jgi:6-methylsalicylate decarboxylase
VRIDVHAHYSPTAYFDRMEALGAFEEIPIFQIMKALYRPDTRKPGGLKGKDRNDVGGRLVDMDNAGVDMQVLGLGAAQPYFGDADRAAEGARLANDLTASVVDTHPDRFSAFAAVPLPHPAAAIAEVVRCLDVLGFAGVGLGCSAAGIALDDPRFEELWAAIDERSAVVFLHPGVGAHGIVGCGEHHLAPDFVSPSELAVAAARLIVTGVTTRYPNVRFLLATTGGSLPFFAGRFDRGLRQDDGDLYEELGGFLPHLRTFHYDTSVLEEPLVLRTAAELFGTDRLVLGSDFSRPGVTSKAAVSYVLDESRLSDADKRAILDENAARLLGPRVRREAR